MNGESGNRWGPWLVILLLVGIVGTLIVLDRRRPAAVPAPTPPGIVHLRLAITQDLEIAGATDFGEPPQIAVWLEPLPKGPPRTLYVSYRSGTGDWKGKSECPDVLPRWFAAYRAEHGVETGCPTPQNPLPDAIAQATPQTPDFTIEAQLTPGSRWRIWLEVNLSADYNDAFPAFDENGMDDLHANGQPSLLYTAEFTAKPKAAPQLALTARTIPNSLTAETTPDLSGITSARHLLPKLELRIE
ncbi:MAG: hypothetical protein HN849_33655 [Victivallales bacterium]|nr:hypothetical protein [Victivallales bacterium]